MPSAKLQDPNIIIEKVDVVVREFEAKYSDIASIGIDGQMHGVIYEDQAGKTVSPLSTWKDNRGNLPFGESSFVSEMERISGCKMSTGLGLSTHYWMTKNHRIPAEAVKICSIFDYAAMRLTGRKIPVITGKIPGGIPVSIGIGDNQASFIGSIRSMEMSALVNMGTGG